MAISNSRRSLSRSSWTSVSSLAGLRQRSLRRLQRASKVLDLGPGILLELHVELAEAAVLGLEDRDGRLAPAAAAPGFDTGRVTSSSSRSISRSSPSRWFFHDWRSRSS